MKSIFPGVVLSLAIIAATPLMAGEVTPASGAVQLGFAGKWLYGYAQRDDETLYPGRERMTSTLAELRISGALAANIDYDVEIAASYNQDFQAGSIAQASPHETGTAGIRQVRFQFRDLVPWTTIQLGTFIPPLTNYMSRPVNDLDLIQYPLLNNAVNMDTGFFGNRVAGRDLSPWQQAGFNLTIRLPYMIDIDLGMWNGMMPNRLANINENLAKATSIVLTFYYPREPLSLSVASWAEEFQPDGAFPGLAPGCKRQLTSWYLFAAYQSDLLEITADYAQASINSAQFDSDGTAVDLNWEGWQVTVGYWLRPEFEVLVRYEYFDPNTIDSLSVPQSRYDDSRWLTLGLNWRLTEWAEVSVNYVRKGEDAEMVEEGRPGRDPNLPGYDAEFSAQNNDLILVQVQVWK